MNLKQFLLVSLIGASSLYTQAQQNQTLFTINSTPYYTDEFIRVYNKNLELVKDESQKNLDTYLDLFLAYKLKVKKAYDLELDKNPSHLIELDSYRTQLAKNYLTDTKITEELIKEAYDRSLKEVRASHILISVDENASEQDIVKAKQKANDIRKRILAGEDFKKLASELSHDPSAKENFGDLGYFSVFKMVYPFESAAFNTKVGEVSEPVRTRFGFHIIKTDDIRDNRGEISISHIMIFKPEDQSKRTESIEKINTIYKKLQQGEKFEDLASQFSEDKSSAQKGGSLARISSGQLNSIIFEDAAFSIKNVGDYTKPIESEFGWHIIKLNEKYPTKTFEEARYDIENRIKRDDRAKIIEESMNSKLEAKYKPILNTKAINTALELITDKYFEIDFVIPENTDKYNKVYLTIGEKNISGIEFLNFIKKQQPFMQGFQPAAKAKTELVKSFVNVNLSDYHNERLELEYPEFNHTMQEYKEGLLLFDLMDNEIWKKAQNDSVGLQEFYDLNKEKYKWKNRVNAMVASSVKKDIVEKTKKLFEKRKSVDYIKKELNKGEIVNIMIDQGLYEEGSFGIPKEYKLQKGISPIYKQGDYYYVINASEILPESIKSLEEAKGKVISDYQQYLEDTWLDKLKAEYQFTVDKNVLENVKKQINK